MVKLSDLFRESTIEIPSVGEVRLREASIGSLRTASEISENEPEEAKSAVFSNNLLSHMIVYPNLSVDQIAELSEEQIRPLALEAAKLQNAANFSDWSDFSEEARAHLYKAIEDQQGRFFEDVTRPAMESLAKYPAILGMNSDLVTSALFPLSDTVSSLVGMQLPAFRADMVSALLHIDSLAIESLALRALPESALGISQSFLDASSVHFGDNLMAAYSALSIVPNNIAQLAKSSLMSVTSALTSEMSILPGIAETITSQLKFPNALIARGLIYSGIDNPSIHSQGYFEPNYIIVENETDAHEAEEQEERQRRLRCQDAFFELELRLREVVQTELQSLNGKLWWRQRVSKGIRNKCSSKKAKREVGSAPQFEPIHYSDFSEIKDIIVQSNNWKDAFEPLFHNEIIFFAMYQLVTVVRNDLDHSRTPSNHDYMRFIIAVNWFYEMLGLLEPFEVKEVPG